MNEGTRSFLARSIDKMLFVAFCAVLTKPFCHCFCIEYRQRYSMGIAIASFMLLCLLSFLRERVSITMHVVDEDRADEEDENDM